MTLFTRIARAFEAFRGEGYWPDPGGGKRGPMTTVEAGRLGADVQRRSAREVYDAFHAQLTAEVAASKSTPREVAG